jgi:acyl-coenzyme A thioesterase PaaI-like protein
MTETFQTINKNNFINFCKNTIPSVKDFNLKINRFEKSGLEMDFFPDKKRVGLIDRFWSQNLFTLADMVSYGCLLCRYPTAIPSVTINFNGNFFDAERVCDVRVSNTLKEYKKNYAYSTVEVVTFSNRVIAKLTCNYMILHQEKLG